MDIDLRDEKIIKAMNKLKDMVRAEYNTISNFLDFYVDNDYIDKVNTLQNQVIYGRRGTGKTHLFRALQETTISNFADKRYFPIYIDLRKYKPLLQDKSPLYYSLIIFKEIVIEAMKCLVENIAFILDINSNHMNHPAIEAAKNMISIYAEKLNFSFNGIDLVKLGDVDFEENEVNKYAASLSLSQTPSLGAEIGKENSKNSISHKVKYLSFSDLIEIINDLTKNFDLERLFFLLDEWSEIPIDSQCFLAEHLKTAFIASNVTVKIAAIPNRTKLVP